MTRVLMTGADGFVGSNVLKYMLQKTDWQFTCLCSWRHNGNPLNIKPDPRVTVITHDLIGAFPEIGDFDYILNLASESHVDRSITDPVNFIENNVSSTLQTLEYARKHVPKVFLQFSTDEVYGDSDHHDWDVLIPSNPYSASKACQEMECIAYGRTYDLPIIITNSNNIIGPDQHPEKFVPKIVRQINGNEEVIIHASNGKPGVRYWNPVENIADALIFILVNTLQPYKRGVRPHRFSLPGGQKLDNLQMAQLVAGLLKKPLHYKLVDVEAIRPGYDTLYPGDDGKLLGLGWIPPYTLKQGLTWLHR